jgi:hypothetical protein
VWSSERFLLPALPLLLLFAAEGAVRLVQAVAPDRVAPVGGLAAALLLAAAAPGIATQVQTGRTCSALYAMGDPFPCLSPEWRDYFDAAVWSAGALPADASFVTRKPRLWWGLSDRTAVIYPLVEDADSLFAVARAARARYLVIDYLGGLTQAYVVPVVLGRPAGFCLVHATQTGTAILGIREGAAGLPVNDTAAAGVNFPVCPDEFWRDPAEREAAMRRLGVTR